MQLPWNPFRVTKRSHKPEDGQITCVHSYAVRSDPLDKDRDAVDGKVVPETTAHARYSLAGAPPPLPRSERFPTSGPARPASPSTEQQLRSNSRRRSDSAHSTRRDSNRLRRYPELCLDEEENGRSKLELTNHLRQHDVSVLQLSQFGPPSPPSKDSKYTRSRSTSPPQRQPRLETPFYRDGERNGLVGSSREAPIEGMASLVDLGSPISRAEIFEPRAVPLYRPQEPGDWIEVTKAQSRRPVKVRIGPFDESTLSEEMLDKVKASREEEERVEKLERRRELDQEQSQHLRRKVRARLGI